MSKKDDNEASLRDSGATPYLYADYLDARDILNERAFYRFTTEIESQFKKPYIVGDHVQSEWQYATPEFPGVYPPPPGGGTADCTVAGSALGGGYGQCNPKDNCGVWVFSCCHKIISFTAINGVIKSITHEANDICRVVYCSDKDKGSITTTIPNVEGLVIPIGRSCLGTDPDPACVGGSCADCVPPRAYLSITYTTQQMSCNGTQTLSVNSKGGGGPYTWSVIAGGGSVSPSSGSSTTYTAPSSNAECANNPTIQLKDFCKSTTTLKIAVNCYTGNEEAYKQVGCKANRSYSCVWPSAYWGAGYVDCSCGTILEQSTWKCNGAYVGVANCASSWRSLTTYAPCSNCPETSFCAPVPTCATIAKQSCCGTLGATCDTRTSTIKTQGCCPAALL